MRASPIALAACLALGSLVLGCAPDLWLRTAPPPTANQVRVLSDEIELTEGVGLGFGVDCVFLSCGDIRVAVDAPGTARAYLAHLDRRNIGWTLRTRPGVVLVGVSPGVTLLHVWNDNHVRHVRVTVLPANSAGAAREAAPPAAPSGAAAP